MTRKSRNSDDVQAAAAPVRVDKWLWAARFFKTRSLAANAVKGGKVHVNDHRAKPSASLRTGDRLSVTKGEVAYEIVVEGLSDKRGPASVAAALYTETPASVAYRGQRAAERNAARISMPRPSVRPDKKQRRQLRRFKQGD